MIPPISSCCANSQKIPISGASVILECLDYADDCGGLLLNGKIITGNLEEWDYQNNEWSDTFIVYNDASYPPPWIVGSRQPVANSLMYRRVSWWTVASWNNNGGKFYKLKYNGPICAFDAFNILLVDIGGGVRFTKWRFSFYIGDNLIHQWEGGKNETYNNAFPEGYVDITPSVIIPNTSYLRYYTTGKVVIPEVLAQNSNIKRVRPCCVAVQNNYPPLPPISPLEPYLDLFAIPDSTLKKITLHWSVVNSEAVYPLFKVYKAGDLIAEVSENGYEDSDVDYGSYIYFVEACNELGEPQLGSSVKVNLTEIPPAYIPPLPPPSVVSASPNNEEQIIIVTWSGVFSATSYNVYRAMNPDGPYALINENVSGLFVEDADVERGVNYYYKVRSNNGATNPTLSTWASARLNLISEYLLTETEGRILDETGNYLIGEQSDL